MKQTHAIGVSPIGLAVAFLLLGAGMGLSQQVQPLNTVNAELDRRARDVGSLQAFRIGPGDLLNIRVFQVPDLTGDFAVELDGTLSLPFVNEKIPAAGKSPAELGDYIADLLKKKQLLNDPQVIVSVREYHSGSVSVVGAVRSTTVFQASQPIRLTGALARAGGLADDAANVAIIRRPRSDSAAAGSKPDEGQTLTIDMSKLLSGEDNSADVPILGGDTITIPRGGLIYVVGAVNRPGGFMLRHGGERMTILVALALAGDLKSTSRPDKSVIIRKDADGREVPVALDVRKILSGRTSGPVLQANDILFVPDSPGKRAIRRAAETTLGLGASITTGLIVYRR